MRARIVINTYDQGGNKLYQWMVDQRMSPVGFELVKHIADKFNKLTDVNAPTIQVIDHKNLLPEAWVNNE